jgi:adenosine/AMP kinase
MAAKLISGPIQKTEAIHVILGQARFIKTVEDLHEVLVTADPGIAFGLALCESSGRCVVRGSGTESDAAARKALLRQLGYKL